MNYQEVIKHYGNKARLARELGITRQAVGQWRETIPYHWQCQLQVETKGRLKAAKRSG